MSNRSPRLMSRKAARAVKLAHRAYLATPMGSDAAVEALAAVVAAERAGYAAAAERALVRALRAPLAPVQSLEVVAAQQAGVRAIGVEL